MAESTLAITFSDLNATAAVDVAEDRRALQAVAPCKFKAARRAHEGRCCIAEPQFCGLRTGTAMDHEIEGDVTTMAALFWATA